MCLYIGIVVRSIMARRRIFKSLPALVRAIKCLAESIWACEVSFFGACITRMSMVIEILPLLRIMLGTAADRNNISVPVSALCIPNLNVLQTDPLMLWKVILKQTTGAEF